jgi:replication factor C subunit 1
LADAVCAGAHSIQPPHKGQKEVPVGASNCLAGLSFVFTGVLDSLERTEAQELVEKYGGYNCSHYSDTSSFAALSVVLDDVF